MTDAPQIRPLRRGSGPGSWRSRDGRWRFLKDPTFPEWFAYLDDDNDAGNVGAGCWTLQDAVDWAERESPQAYADVEAERARCASSET